MTGGFVRFFGAMLLERSTRRRGFQSNQKNVQGGAFGNFISKRLNYVVPETNLSRRLKKTNLINIVYFFKSLWSRFYAFTTNNSFNTYVQRITNIAPLSL